MSLVAFWDHHWMGYLKDLVVLVHEICHATVALFTGGQVKGIALHGDEGGETIAIPSNFRASFMLVVSAGYIGSSIVGGFLLKMGFQRIHPRQTIVLFGILLITVSILFSQIGDLAYSTGIFWGVFLVILGFLGEIPSVISLVFLGTSISLYSIYDLSDFADRVTETDAGILAVWMCGLSPEDLEEGTLPGYVVFLGYLIATLWSTLSLSVLYYFLRSSFLSQENAENSDTEESYSEDQEDENTFALLGSESNFDGKCQKES